MFALMLLAAMGQVPAAADEWRPFAANPRYEVRGRVDARGVFRYTRSRLKAPAPPTPRATPRPAAPPMAGYAIDGVLIDPDRLIVGTVRGTDGALARDIAEKDRRFHARENDRDERPGTGATVEQAAPCPGPGPCPKKPAPPPVPAPPAVPAALGRDAVIIVFAVALTAIVGSAALVLFLIALAWAARALVRLCTAPGHQVD